MRNIEIWYVNFKLPNFLYAHDNIKGNLPTTLCAGITLFNSKHADY